MTIEQLLLLAVFVLASLLNLVVQALRRRRQAAGQMPEGEAEGREPRPSPLPPSAVYRETSARPTLRRRAEEPRVEPPPAARQRRRRPRVRFRSAAEVRRAFVLMTVMGPCRGLEPPARPRVDRAAAATGSGRAG